MFFFKKQNMWCRSRRTVTSVYLLSLSAATSSLSLFLSVLPRRLSLSIATIDRHICTLSSARCLCLERERRKCKERWRDRENPSSLPLVTRWVTSLSLSLSLVFVLGFLFFLIKKNNLFLVSSFFFLRDFFFYLLMSFLSFDVFNVCVNSLATASWQPNTSCTPLCLRTIIIIIIIIRTRFCQLWCRRDRDRRYSRMNNGKERMNNTTCLCLYLQRNKRQDTNNGAERHRVWPTRLFVSLSLVIK